MSFVAESLHPRTCRLLGSAWQPAAASPQRAAGRYADAIMRERITIEQIRCERCIARLADELAPLEGLAEARVEMGTSSVIVDYEDGRQGEVDAAIERADFTITGREPAPLTA